MLSGIVAGSDRIDVKKKVVGDIATQHGALEEVDIIQRLRGAVQHRRGPG